MVLLFLAIGSAGVRAQDFDDAVVGPLPQDTLPAVEATPADGIVEPITQRLNLFDLLVKGGWLMVPIGLMSVLVVMLVFEVFLALRRRSPVIPQKLIESLADLGAVPGMMDPRAAYRLCQQYPSSAAGRHSFDAVEDRRRQSEVEHAVAEAGERGGCSGSIPTFVGSR